jgi:hypothetical protein
MCREVPYKDGIEVLENEEGGQQKKKTAKFPPMDP